MELEEQILELVANIRENSGNNVVSFNLFINYQEVKVNKEYQFAKELKIRGIAMRNINGNWIE